MSKISEMLKAAIKNAKKNSDKMQYVTRSITDSEVKQFKKEIENEAEEVKNAIENAILNACQTTNELLKSVNSANELTNKYKKDKDSQLNSEIGIKKSTHNNVFEKSCKEFEEAAKKASWTKDASKSTSDMVNSPSHYKGHKFEVIDIIEDFDLNFRKGNALKYLLRAGHKDDYIQDLKKAIWYLNREIETYNSNKGL